MDYYFVELDRAFFLKNEDESSEIFWLDDEKFGIVNTSIAVNHIRVVQKLSKVIGASKNDDGISFKLDFLVIGTKLNDHEFWNYIFKNASFILSCLKYASMQYGFPRRVTSFYPIEIVLKRPHIDIVWKTEAVAPRDFVNDAVCIQDLKEAKLFYQKQEIPGHLLLLVDSLEALFIENDFVKSMIYSSLSFEAIVKFAIKEKIANTCVLPSKEIENIYSDKIEKQLHENSYKLLGKSFKKDHPDAYRKIIDHYRNERNNFVHIGRSSMVAAIDDFDKFDQVFSILKQCHELGQYYGVFKKYPSFLKSKQHFFEQGNLDGMKSID